MFDGNGNWTSDFSAQADRDNGIKILASRFDNIFIADIKESFENCLTKDGQIVPIGNFNAGGHRVTNVANGVNSGDGINKGQLDTLSNSAVKLTGNQTIADVKTFTSSPVLPTPTAGDNSTKGATTAFVQTAISKETFPDYANTSTASNNYTVLADGWVSVKVNLGNNHSVTLKINDVEVYYQNIGGDRSAGGTFTSPLYKVRTGDEVTTSGTNTRTITFYPLRG